MNEHETPTQRAARLQNETAGRPFLEDEDEYTRPGPTTLVVAYDVTRLTDDEVDVLTGQALAQGEESGDAQDPGEYHASAPAIATGLFAMPLERVQGACEIAAESWEPPAEPRVVLVHLNYELPAEVDLSPEALGVAVVSALRDAKPERSPWLTSPTVALAEEVSA